MANHPSAEKRHLQSLKRNARNRANRSFLSTQVKKARQELASGQAKPDAGEVRNAQSVLAKYGRKGLISKKNAQRRISRLMKQAASQNS